jgi:ATP-dependent RNA helicase RhlE
MGYTTPTPIQREAIPLVLEGRDIVGCAQTGTGKTAAFVLPILQRVRVGGTAGSAADGAAGIVGRGVNGRGGPPRVLVVTPTRELALQIDGVAREAARFTGHRVSVIHGGVGYQRQIDALRRGIDILVGTPGRLLDMVEKRALDLGHVEVLVLDEADRMLDMGFWPQVRRILALLPRRRQNLLFSATMTREVLGVIGSTLNEPAHINVAPPAMPVEKVTQQVYPVGGQQKADLLVRLIEQMNLERVLVFTRTKHRADRVAKALHRCGIDSVAIHGNRSQSQRQNALEGFREGRHRVLVATDIVARGIDVEDISHVVNFDMPTSAEDYVHRIGRTARAGRSGTAVSLLAPEDHESLRDIERKIGTVIECADLEGFRYSPDRRVPDPGRHAARGPRNGHAEGTPVHAGAAPVRRGGFNGQRGGFKGHRGGFKGHRSRKIGGGSRRRR